jgi:hypothetical protein
MMHKGLLNAAPARREVPQATKNEEYDFKQAPVTPCIRISPPSCTPHCRDLVRYGAPWIKHCFAVSSLATYLSNIFTSRYPVNIEFVRTAALLHDIYTIGVFPHAPLLIKAYSNVNIFLKIAIQ